MGPAFVLLFWGIIGVVVATCGAVTLGLIATFSTIGVPKWRTTVVFVAAVFPFACLAWCGIVFWFQAIINVELLQRDMGIGDSWNCPLPNGYAIQMIDVTDQGVVYHPDTKPNGMLMSDDDNVFGVRTLQVEGNMILGAADTHYFEHLGTAKGGTDSFFVLDAHTRRKKVFKHQEEFEVAAAAIGIVPKLEPIDTVYSKYYAHWFEWVALALFIGPPIAGAASLFVWIVRLRRSRPPTV